MSTTEEVTVHLGKKIKGVRELLEIKQETLAGLLGNGMTQQDISYLEKQKSVDNETLSRVAKALGVTTDTIRNFKPESVLNSNIYNFSENAVQNQQSYNEGTVTFNAAAKAIEAYEKLVEEIKKNAQLEARISALEALINKK